jgi:hypothetical protein
VPCAITGTERLFLGPLPKPRRVQVAFSTPIHVAHLTSTQEAATRVVEEALWTEVESEFRRLSGAAHAGRRGPRGARDRGRASRTPAAPTLRAVRKPV